MYSWEMNPKILGLSLLTINVGVAGMQANAAGVPKDAQKRALVETLALSALAAHLSRNVWPVVFPLVYLAVDYAWATANGHPPQVGASEDKTDYGEYAHGD